jgi:hypothetical protein
MGRTFGETMRRLLLFPLLLTACDGGFACKDECDSDAPAPDADTDTDADSDADTDTDTDADSDLQDARDAMQRDASGCQDFEGTPLAGAARYFWGEYHGNATEGWTGQEAAYIFANDAWKDLGGEDCVALWAVSAVAGSNGSCPTCELGISVSAVYDLVNSTCPEAMYGGDFSTAYAVDTEVDGAGVGTTTWYYASSADRIGTGYAAPQVLNFVTDRACNWY